MLKDLGFMLERISRIMIFTLLEHLIHLGKDPSAQIASYQPWLLVFTQTVIPTSQLAAGIQHMGKRLGQ